MAVQLQWGLEKTSNSTIEIATGLMRAATTDNVQPLAILACEQFGNTLAVSPEALRKVEHSVLPTPKPAIVSFLQSSVGYSANDCASQFGRNTAGLQFLALATALITTMGSWKSGAAIHEMLASSAKDKTLLPTVRQVVDLTVSIEPRCNRASLADDVFGWQTLLRQSTHEKIWERFGLESAAHHPSSEGIQNLVDALRQLRRIGNEDVTNVTIKTVLYAAWTMVFVKWSLGYPPTVILSDGTPILHQAGSDVTLVLEERGSLEKFRVITHSSIHGPSELVEPNASAFIAGQMIGMITLKNYGTILQQRWSFKSGLSSDAFQEAIPYALQQVIRKLVFHPEDLEVPMKQFSPPAIVARRQMSISPFPHDWEISNICRLLFDREPELRYLEDDTRIADLPLMALYLADLRKLCSCLVCKAKGSATSVSCKVVNALEGFHAVISDILALSLFERPESLRVSVGASYGGIPGRSELIVPISGVLRTGRSSVCFLDALLSRALALVGHQTSLTHIAQTPWVMSSYRGQTVWATLFETLNYDKRGLLRLSWLPGVLRHRGDVYEQARGPVQPRSAMIHCTETRPETVLRPCNLYTGVEATWHVAAAHGALEVALGVRRGADILTSSLMASPWTILRNLAECFLVEDCIHGPESSLEEPDHLCKFSQSIGPSFPAVAPPIERLHTDEPSNQQSISIVPVDGHQGLRLLSLSEYHPTNRVVVRQKACLACCLDACRRAGATRLIL